MKLKNKTEKEIKEIFVPGRTFYVAGGDKYHVVNFINMGCGLMNLCHNLLLWSKTSIMG